MVIVASIPDILDPRRQGGSIREPCRRSPYSAGTWVASRAPAACVLVVEVIECKFLTRAQLEGNRVLDCRGRRLRMIDR